MVGSIDANSVSGATLPSQSQLQQIKADFNQLKQSLQSGDLSGAQQAFADLQKLAPQGASGPFQNQINALGQALQSGNLSAAQQAFSALQSTAESHGPLRGAPSAGASSANGANGSSSTKTVVRTTQSISPDGKITTVTQYSDGTTSTTTSYGPASNSTQSVVT